MKIHALMAIVGILASLAGSPSAEGRGFGGASASRSTGGYSGSRSSSGFSGDRYGSAGESYNRSYEGSHGGSYEASGSRGGSYGPNGFSPGGTRDVSATVRLDVSALAKPFARSSKVAIRMEKWLNFLPVPPKQS
jgi:hypothetical protein